MFKIFLLLCFPFAVYSQINNDNVGSENDLLSEQETTFHHYVSLNDNKIYDVEIIVFAYKNALPNYKTYTNKELFDYSNALDLQLKPEDLDFIQSKESFDNNIINSTSNTTDTNSNTNTNTNTKTSSSSSSSSEFTVSISDDQQDKQVLTWFLHDPNDYKLTSIWSRLSNQDNIVPLIHQSWRQNESPFDNPTYIKLNNLPEEDEVKEVFNNGTNNPIENSINADMDFLTEEDLLENKLNAYSDFTVTGMVALSQGRFMHFGHSLNLIRQYQTESNVTKSMVFSLTERKQLKPDELHYFDSPWFGSIVKITEYLGEESNED